MLRRRARRPGSRPGATFADAALQAELERSGYVVVPLLTSEQVAAVLALLASTGVAPGDPQQGLFNDSWSIDREHTARRSAALADIVGSSVDRLAPDHRALIWGTSVKWPGEAGAVVAHRDPTFVDERSHRSVGVWCALEPLGPETGTLIVHPGTHRASTRVRVHQSSRNLRPDLDLRTSGVAVCLEPGAAIVYDHSLLHGSRAIAGERPRVALMSHLVPLAADVRYAVPVGEHRAAELHVDPGFFVRTQMDQLDVPALLAAHPTVSTFDDRDGVEPA